MTKQWGCWPFIILLLIVAIVVGNETFFAIDEKEQVLVLQLGQYVTTHREPGLGIKVPFVQSLVRFDKRVLDYDAAATELLTKDKKNLVIDNYARWRIVDPLKFYQTVRDEIGAQARIDDIIFSELREELAKDNLSDVIKGQRESIMNAIARKSDEKAREYGIEILDVRIKRADLPKEVAQSVYARMTAERQRIAKRFRSEGEEQAIQIRAETDRDRVTILAEAYKESQRIQGEGDAEAIKIYADAYQQDEEFFAFQRALAAYKTALASNSTVVFTTDSDLFLYLESPTAPSSRVPASGGGDGSR